MLRFLLTSYSYVLLNYVLYFFTWLARHLSKTSSNFAKLQVPRKRSCLVSSFLLRSLPIFSISGRDNQKPHLQLKTTSAITRTCAFFKCKINSAKLSNRHRVYRHTPRCSCHRWPSTCKNDVRVYTRGAPGIIILFITGAGQLVTKILAIFITRQNTPSKHSQTRYGSSCT